MSESEIGLRRDLLMRQVLLTWSPPLQGAGSKADIAQTVVMQTIAFVFGAAVLPKDLTYNQERAIAEGLELMERELLDSNLAQPQEATECH